MGKKQIELFMSVLLIFCACLLAGKGWERAMSTEVEKQEGKKQIVIDAGHGKTSERPNEFE